ncbi:C-GCAxxG-C-C family (seleno)protein [Clostridium grantii]|uniref:C_GCAxxG_C_C family probable redox protein n=1 Tax=Clostridium grantii DSM 8605 TaxID=1121316 RepID=A0A1M5QNK5_9CLOT|nr:C-GCAxxG-C-C family (seleno)protein [Clostridium grantii]SHH15672.1 C_GCAxxG_C_C family probable redox protein [Clostridium grantii DSM 8605]
MLLKTMEKYRNKDHYDLSCSESIIYAANEEYNLNLSKDSFKTMAAFSGGMYSNEACGCITGSLAVLGILFVEKGAHESDYIKNLTVEFINKFEEKFGSRKCEPLKESYRTEEQGCNSLIYSTAELLDELVLRELNK